MAYVSKDKANVKAGKYTEEARAQLIRKDNPVAIPESWIRDLWNFIEDVGIRPPNTTLQRRDETLPHSKDNSFWGEPRYEASRKHPLRIPSRLLKASGLKEATVRQRVSRGMSLEDALATPLRPVAVKKGWTYRGHHVNIAKLEDCLGLHRPIITRLVEVGFNVDQAVDLLLARPSLQAQMRAAAMERLKDYMALLVASKEVERDRQREVQVERETEVQVSQGK